MSIAEKFGQAVIGTETADAERTFIQIHRREINLVSASLPPSAGTTHYLNNLDIENRYLKSKTGERFSGYGYDPAFFFVTDGVMEGAHGNELPDMDGYTDLLKDLKDRAGLFSAVTGYDTVQVMVRVLSAAKNLLCVHVDNDTSLRGLQTLMGNANTLWLPDQDVNSANHEWFYDDNGQKSGNALNTTFNDLVKLQQVQNGHMSIHKGENYPNPLFHSAPGLNPELNMVPGSRVIVTFDRA